MKFPKENKIIKWEKEFFLLSNANQGLAYFKQVGWLAHILRQAQYDLLAQLYFSTFDSFRLLSRKVGQDVPRRTGQLPD